MDKTEAAKYFEKKGYDVNHEHPIKGNGAIDILATRGSRRVAVEVETGKSNIKANLEKIKDAGFDRVVFIVTSPTAVSACQRAIEAVEYSSFDTTELLTWLDIS